MKRFWPSLVIALLGFGILIKLGLWQLSRIPEKEGEIARIEAYFGQDPVAVPQDPDPVADEYLPVQAVGLLGAEELHVLVSTRDYGAGYRIIAPFVLEDGRQVMLDRGYVRTEFKTAPRTGGRFEVIGNLHWPDERTGATPENDVAGNIWFARDVEVMAAALGTEPILIIARTVTDEAVLPLPVSTDFIPNNHLSYAIQWFIFAALWLGMTSVVLWRIRGKNRQQSDAI